jgi:hypothetical protein
VEQTHSVTRRLLDIREASGKYGLVILLLGLAYVVTASADTADGNAVVLLVQAVTLWLVFAASESHRAQRAAGIVAVLVAIAAVTASLLGHALSVDKTEQKFLSIGSAFIYVIASIVIVRHLASRKRVDLRTLLGTIAVYLMLGMVFAFTYRSISLVQTEPAFFGSAGAGGNADFLFFSFITLTTTGYGNLVPAANPGQSLAVLEAIIGQLFLVTALAKIVSAWRPGSALQTDDHVD